MLSEIANSIALLKPLDYLIIAIAVVLMVFADWLVQRLLGKKTEARNTRFLINAIRGLGVLLIALLGYVRFYLDVGSSHALPIKILSILVIVYLTYLTSYFFGEFIHRRYGRVYSQAGRDRIADTYTSRALSIFVSIFLGVIALIWIIKIIGLGDTLQTTGVIGFIGVFLALTQGSWAPDIISGLIILNTEMFRERDVVKLDGPGGVFIGTVYRTRAFHTELLSMVDNHRVMIRNSRIRDSMVQNLSRFANARGLRETMRFKIGYDVSPARVKAMFESAYEQAIEDTEILLEGQHPLEVRLQDAGDHAIEWSVHYYTKDEAQLLKTAQLFREKILQASIDADISLSTPISHTQV